MKSTKPVNSPSVHAPGRQALLVALRALKGDCGKSAGGPKLLVGTLLHLWCEGSYPHLRKPRLAASDHLRRRGAVVTFAAFLRRLPLLDAAYWLSTAYATLCSE